MSVSVASPLSVEMNTSDQRFVVDRIRWDAYVTICDALDEHNGVRLIYNDGRLNDAIEAWGRLGIPEVWRFDSATFTCTFWNRRDNRLYELVDSSMFLPMLGPSDVVVQTRLARELGTSKWFRQLEDWVRDVLRPRIEVRA
jgi:hypothetical protein